jgi:Pyridoxamine 5'-phosphate oxidase
MATWSEIEKSAPELAASVRAILDAHTNKILATLRRDGSPRVSGTETQFAGGDLWFGAMWHSRKALDLQRDPRFALHSASPDVPDDPATWPGDAKLAGRVEEITDPERVKAVQGSSGEEPPGPSHLFRADITEMVLTRVGGDPPDHLVIDSWHEGRGLRRVQRR